MGEDVGMAEESNETQTGPDGRTVVVVGPDGAPIGTMSVAEENATVFISDHVNGLLGSHPGFVMYNENVPGCAAHLLYLI